MLLLARGDGVAVDLGEHLDGVAVLVDPGGADEDGAHGLAAIPGDLEVGLEGADLAAERVALGGVVRQPRCSRSSMIIPAQVPSTGVPARDELAQRLGEALALDAERHRRRLAAGDHQPVEAVEVGGHAHLAHVGAEAAQHARVRLEVALQREHADERHGAHQPRLARSCRSSSLRDLERDHRRAEPSRGARDALGVREVRGRLDDRGGAGAPGPRT